MSTRLELPAPADDAPRVQWALRSTDVDLHGHVNNAVHWQAVEDAVRAAGLDPRAPLVAELDYRDPIDLSDRLELAMSASQAALTLGFGVGEAVHAVARVTAARSSHGRTTAERLTAPALGGRAGLRGDAGGTSIRR